MTASLASRLVSRLIFPLQERLKGHDSVARRRALERSQWWSADELERFRVARLRDFLVDVAAHVPYYRHLFTEIASTRPALKSLADLARIPLLDKPLIRANLQHLRSDDAGALKRYNTGGSSGEPLIFYMGKDRISHDVAAKWRATRWWGVDIGDPEVVVWGSPIELGAQDRFRELRDRLLRTKLLPAFEMSAAKLDRFVAEIRAMRPRMVFGYPSALAHIARHAEAKGQRLDDLGIKVAFVTSERLYDRPESANRADIRLRRRERLRRARRRVRRARVPGRRNAHFGRGIVVEIVGPSGEVLPAGESGEIVVTHLATREFPFIRYRTGDIGILRSRPCPCGRGLPMLDEIQGRSTDFVIAEDGTVMHGLALIYVLRDLPEIASFKIVQESRQQVRVQIVPAAPLTPAWKRASAKDSERGWEKASTCASSPWTRSCRNGPANSVTW